MRNCRAEVGPGMRPVEPMLAPQFRIPHSALVVDSRRAYARLGGRVKATMLLDRSCQRFKQ